MLLQGDCLEKMQEIPDGSVDMVLTDPPYGTTACKWDTLGNPATTTWIMADNTTAELSKQDLIDIEDAYAIRQRQVFSEYQSLCEQVAVSNDPEAITWS